MTIDRFREVLGAVGPPPDARELSELLWLACHISGPEETAPPAPVRPQRPVPAPPGPPGFTTPRPDAPVPVPPVPLTALHPPPGPSPVPEPAAGAAAEVLVPTAPMLADPLGVQRALRPLNRRVPSRHRTEVDEEATAARIADTRRWTPVLVPSPERWLSLTLVVDTGPTMRLWRPLARELAETLLRQGAFQDFHVCYLGATGRVTSAPGAPSQDPATLLDASGRHAVLVLSDCSGPHWWDGRAAQAVRRWARAGPTAILQPLPEHLWRRTAAPASPGMALLPRPGAPNTDLRFSPYDGAATPGVHVPVLEVAPRWFGAWARLLSGSGPQPAAIATLPPRPPGTPPPARERELPVAERVRRFLATASPDAAELAAHVAVSVPSLPVMRLIQHRILGRSGPGQLAEVLLSGLLRPAGGVRYEFVPGAREALLDTLPRPEAQHTRHVLEAVSAEIERRAGTSAETFRALLPAEGGPLTLTATTDHFALLTPETRTHLAPATRPPTPVPNLLDIQDASLDELLGENWDGPPRPASIGVDDGLGVVRIDLLSGRGRGPHGLLTGPRNLRDSLLRTLVFGLALGHSPNVVNLAFADFSGGMSFVGLGSLPHVVTAVHTTSAESPLLSRFPDVLETERRRREAVLQDAGTPTWDDYQAALAENGSLDPLPALVVIIDNAGPLLEARPDLIGPLTALTANGEVQGIRFVFCSPESDGALPPELSDFVSWHIGAPGAGGPGSAFLHVPGDVNLSGFRPARISLDAADPIVERMREGTRRVRRLSWPDDAASPSVAAEAAAAEPPSLETAAPPPAVPRFDVLKLNGGGTSGMFEETWARPALEPREPAIGYDADGNVVTLYPLDISAGIPHGLIVGEAEARQRVVRTIALALAASYSPGDLTFAFAGLREHPLGEPLDLPHIRFSDDGLLERPQRLQRFTEFLSDELDERAAATAAGAPGLVIFADAPLMFPSNTRELAGTLLSLERRGSALGIQLLLSSSTVEDTKSWNRFLALLGWRVVAGRMPPAVLQRVLGRGDLPFHDESTAYLRAGDDAPRRFTLAPEPPRPALDDFVRRTHRHREAAYGPATAQSADADHRRVRGRERVVESTSLDGGDRQRLIEAILRTGAMSVQRERAVHVAALERDLGHPLYYAQHDREVPDVWALVDTMLNYPGATQALVRILRTSYPESVSVRALDELVTELLPEPWLDQDDRRELHELITWLEQTNPGLTRLGRSSTLYRRAVGPAWPEPNREIRSMHNVVAHLEEVPAGPDGTPPLLIFVSDLADEAAGPVAPALRNWVRRQADTFDLIEDPAVAEIIRRLGYGEKQSRPPDERRPRHIVYAGTDMPRIARLAAEYGRMLAELGVLAHGDVREATADWLGHVAGEPGTTMADLFRESRGGVLLLHMTREALDSAGAVPGAIFPEQLQALVQEHGEDPVVIVCADDGQMLGLRRFDPHFTDRYRRLLEFPRVKDVGAPPYEPAGSPPDPSDLPDLVYARELPAATGRRIPIGIASGTRRPVHVDFDAEPHLLVAGPPGSGRANVLQLLIDGIGARQGRPEAEIHVYDAHEILLSLAEEFGLTEAAGPGVGYTDSAEEFRETVAGLVRRPPDAEVFLVVIDRDLDDDPLRRLPRNVLTPPGNRVHLVLARLLTVLDQRVDPMVSTLHEIGAPALLLGSRYGEEHRMFGAEPPGGSGVAGRGVLVRGGRRHVLQVAHASPFA